MSRPSSRPSAPETDRLIGDLLRVGVIEKIDLQTGKAQVRMGDQLTPMIDWLMPVGETTVWLPPTEGQQVLVLSPEGDEAQGVILNGLPSSTFAALAEGRKVVVRFNDGARLAYDAEAGQLEFDTPGTVSITAPGGIHLTGDVTITGDAAVSKTLTAQTDVVGGGKSLKGHKHTGVATGSGVSGAPQ